MISTCSKYTLFDIINIITILCQERDKHLKELHGEWTQRAKQAGGNRTLQKVRASIGYVGLSSARG